MSASASTPAAKDRESSTFRGLVAGHKLIAAGVAAVVAVMLATILVPALASRGGAVSDSTTCTQWGSANQRQQARYARLYVREHGPLRGGGTSPASVITAINDGCTRAYGEDVSDSVTVVQAISGRF